MQATIHKRTSGVVALATLGLVALCLLLPVRSAHAQPSIGETVGEVTDTVENTTGTVGKKVSETGAKAGDAVTDTGATVGDTVGGSTGTTVKETTSTAGSAVKDTSAKAGSTFDGTTKELSDGAKEVTRLLDEALGGAGIGTEGSSTNDPPLGKRDTNLVPTTFPTVLDRLRGVSGVPLSLRSAHERDVSTARATSPAAARGGSTLADIVRRALEAVEKFAFPLSLTLLVLAYLSAQGWFDRRDPKLALAAVDPDADLLRFE